MNDSQRRALVGKLRRLQPGDRVRYQGWRGPADRGTGTFLRHVDLHGKTVSPGSWGNTNMDGVVVRRDFSSDDGKTFRPFAGDGESIHTDEMIAEEVLSE